MTDSPIQPFLAWFDAQGEAVKGQILLYSGGMMRQRSTLAEREAKTPLEFLQQCAELSEEIAKSEETFRAWLTAEPRWDRRLCKVLFVRSVVSFLIFRYGHDEGREAVQARRTEDAEHFEKLAGQETDFTRLVRGDPAKIRQESIEWTTASESWRPLCSTSLSDEALEDWMGHVAS
jgi:hypothetical protein